METFFAGNGDDLQAITGYVLLFLVVTLGLEATLDYRAGRKLFSRSTLLERCMSLLWYATMLSMIFLPDLFAHYGLPSWLGYACPILIVLILPLLFSPRATRFQGNAVVNPHGRKDVDMAEAEKFTAEETKVNFKLNALLLAFAAFVFGMICFFTFVMPPQDIAGIVALLGFVAAMMAILIYAVAGRYPGTLEVKSASIIINRPVADIWETVRFRNTTNWWKKIVSRVEKLDQPGERYKMTYFSDDTCGQCGLPRDPEGAGRANLVEVLEVEDLRYMRWRAWPMGNSSVVGLLEHEVEDFTFTAVDATSTQVTSRNIVAKPKIWLWLVLKLGDPLGEELRALKAHLEGTAGGTLFEAGAARVAAHRHAEKFCGCADGTPIANKFFT